MHKAKSLLPPAQPMLPRDIPDGPWQEITLGYCLQSTAVIVGYPIGTAKHPYSCAKEPTCSTTTTQQQRALIDILWSHFAAVSSQHAPGCFPTQGNASMPNSHSNSSFSRLHSMHALPVHFHCITIIHHQCHQNTGESMADGCPSLSGGEAGMLEVLGHCPTFMSGVGTFIFRLTEPSSPPGDYIAGSPEPPSPLGHYSAGSLDPSSPLGHCITGSPEPLAHQGSVAVS